MRRSAVAFILITDLAAVVAACVLAQNPITANDAWLAVFLASLSIAYSIHTMNAEGARYALNQRRATAMSNMLGTWTFPAAVLLPMPLAAGVIVTASAVQWRVKTATGRASLCRYVFSVAAVILAAALANQTMALGSNQELLLSVAASVYIFANVLLVGIAATMASGLSAAKVFLRPRSHINEIRTVMIGGAGAVLWLVHIPLLWLTLPLVIGIQRLEMRSESRNATEGLAAPMTEKVWGTVAREVVRACTTASVLRLDSDDPAAARAIAQLQAGCDAIGAVGASGLVILLADCPGPNADSLALRLRSALASGGVQANVAVAAKPRDGQVLEDLLAVTEAELITREAATRSARSFRPDA
jgi:diguanylate cyclase